MIRRRKIDKTQQELLDVANQAVDQTDRILDHSEQNSDLWANLAALQNDTNKRSLRVTETALKVAQKALELLNQHDIAEIARQDDNRALTAEAMQVAAELFPQWSVSSSMGGGKATKTFMRKLDDMSAEHLEPSEWSSELPLMKRDAYLNFCDSEYFDMNLLRIFGSWNGTGETGSSPHLSITAEVPGPVTYHDIYNISQAEKYLLQAGYITGQDAPTVLESNHA